MNSIPFPLIMDYHWIQEEERKEDKKDGWGVGIKDRKERGKKEKRRKERMVKDRKGESKE